MHIKYRVIMHISLKAYRVTARSWAGDKPTVVSYRSTTTRRPHGGYNVRKQEKHAGGCHFASVRRDSRTLHVTQYLQLFLPPRSLSFPFPRDFRPCLSSPQHSPSPTLLIPAYPTPYSPCIRALREKKKLDIIREFASVYRCVYKLGRESSRITVAQSARGRVIGSIEKS